MSQATKRRHSVETKELAKKMRNDGKTYYEISNILNITKSLIRHWCDPIAREKELIHNKKYNQEYYKNPLNKAKKAEYFQNRMKENPEHLKYIKQKSRSKNKEKNQKKSILRYHNDPIFKMIGLQRYRIRSLLKNNDVIKNKRTYAYLGCTGQELKEYLEKQFKDGMTWENHGKFGWHVDHIQPLHVFDLTDPEQCQIAFHYTNLQPLWWYDNLSKNKGIRFKNDK